MIPDYADNLYGPVKFGALMWIHIEGTVAGGSGAITTDATNSTPGATITGGGSGQATIAFPKGSFAFPVGNVAVLLAESAGAEGHFEALSAANGTGTIEFSVTPGTAANLADNSRVFVNLLVGRRV